MRRAGWASILILLACGETQAPPGPKDGGPEATARGPCDALWEALTTYAACARRPFVDAIDDRMGFVAMCASAVGASGAKGMQALAACTDAANAAAANCDPIGDACVITGTLPSGSPCGAHVQCESGYCSNGNGASPFATAFASPCGVCAPRLVEDQICSPQTDGPWFAPPCGAPTSCVYDENAFIPRCTVRDADVGQACGSKGVDDAHCRPELRCDWTTNLCATRSSVGGHCWSHEDCLGHLVCVPDSTDSLEHATCKEPIPDGAACQIVPDFSTGDPKGIGCARTSTCSAPSWLCAPRQPRVIALSCAADAGGTSCGRSATACYAGQCVAIAAQNCL